MKPKNCYTEIPAWWTSLNNSTLDWHFQTVPQTNAFLSSGGVAGVPRGKVLGGSSVINGMVYVRGNRNDYDYWESLGNEGWGYDDVLPYFIKSERVNISHLENSRYHGTKGLLDVGYPRYTSKVQKAILEGGNEMGILNEANDYNGQTQFGMSQTQDTLRNGLRSSTNKAFLRPAKRRSNLHITLNSLATKIVINPTSKRARCVRFVRDGRSYRVIARKEIILSAGAIQSPQLLLLSGVGDERQLNEHGIGVIEDLPGVGENLQDHIGFFPVFSIQNPDGNKTLSIISKNVLTEKSINQFVHKDNGLLYSQPFGETLAFINSKYQNASIDWPDIQCIFGSTIDIVGVTQKDGLNTDGIFTVPFISRPESRGRVYLKSKDPFEYPLIDPKYLTVKQDLLNVVSISMNESIRTQEISYIFIIRLKVSNSY